MSLSRLLGSHLANFPQVNLVSNKAIVNPDWIASTYDWSGTGGIPQTTATSAFTLDVGAIWYNAFQAATGFSGQVYGEDPGLQYSALLFSRVPARTFAPVLCL